MIIEGRIYVGFRIGTEAIVIQLSFCAQMIDDEQSKFRGKPRWGHCYGGVYKSALQKVQWLEAATATHSTDHVDCHRHLSARIPKG